MSCRVETSNARGIDLKLEPGQVRSLRTPGPVAVRFRSGGGPVEYQTEPNSIYCFVADEAGLDLHEIGLGRATLPSGGADSTAAATAAAGTPTDGDQGTVDPNLAAGVLTVKLLVDDDQPGARSYWEKKLRDRLAAASRVLRQHCGVELRVVDVGTWQSDPQAQTVGEVLADFETQVDPAPARLAVGCSSQLAELPLTTHLGGIRGPLARHLVVPEPLRPSHPDVPLELLLHELGHFFAAVHSPEPMSAMRPVPTVNHEMRPLPPAVDYDPVSALVMSSVAEDLRVVAAQDLVDLRPATRGRLERAYRLLRDALPSDPAPARWATLGLVGRLPAAARAPTQPVAGESEAARAVVQGVVAVAEANALLASQPAAAGAEPAAAGDRLTELYYQAAAETAWRLPEGLRARAFLVGLGVALDRSDMLRGNFLYRGLLRQVETDSERTDRLRVLGSPAMFGRTDLPQHFAISGLLLATGGVAAAETIGIFKELNDAQGGTGFSFVDLQADLAGITFAQHVLSGRLPLDQLAAGFKIEHYVPEDRGLREGLSWEQFLADYGSTNDPRFTQELTALRRRVETSPRYIELARAAGDPRLNELLAQVAEAGPPDPIRELQTRAQREGRAPWGYWGAWPEKYHGWASHSNRLIPVYTFGLSLEGLGGEHSPYRDPARLAELYGAEPAGTLNPQAQYFDQTDIFRLQQQAVAAGKKYVILFVFDGLDWQTTWAAAIVAKGQVAYREGRGTGLAFQDYQGTTTDFGFCVTSPRTKNVRLDVDQQVVLGAEGDHPGGYDAALGGDTPWAVPSDPTYLLGQGRERQHTVTDSSASATSLTAGIKTYNQAINVDVSGRQVVPIARTLQTERGWAVGAVTSVPISHATPACAYANNVARDDFQDLTRDMLGLRSVAHRQEPLAGLDVLLGAGWGQVVATHSDQGQNYVAGNPYLTAEDFQAISVESGGKYRVVQRLPGSAGRETLLTAARAAAEAGQRLFGFFGAAGLVRPNTPLGHLPFRTADGRYDPTAGFYGRPENYSEADVRENPTLADLTEAALLVLEKNPHGFWLMVEPGDVDWANHDNNLDNVIGAVLSGDEAFQRVVAWVEARQAWNETAVIVTADHGHSLYLTQPEVLLPPPDDAAAAAASQP